MVRRGDAAGLYRYALPDEVNQAIQ